MIATAMVMDKKNFKGDLVSIEIQPIDKLELNKMKINKLLIIKEMIKDKHVNLNQALEIAREEYKHKYLLVEENKKLLKNTEEEINKMLNIGQ